MSGEKHNGGTSRRTVLRLAGTGGALAGLAQITGLGRTANFRRTQPIGIELDGEVSGWVGRSPEPIAGRTNPALSLELGRTYRVTWTNADGAPHNLVVVDAGGTRLAGTEIVAEEGASRTLEFEATPAMAEYLCEVHPQSMRGRVAVGDGETTAGSETTTDSGTTPDRQPPVLSAETIVLGGLATHWLGLAPNGIRGRANPTLRLRAGREYELAWVNLDGVEHDFHLADAEGEDLADTSSREDVGDTHDTDFEATAEMATYYCEFHPRSMRGTVEVV